MSEPAAPSPAPTVSATSASGPAVRTPEVPEASPLIQDLTPPQEWWQSRAWAWTLLAVSSAALLLGILLWQKLSGIQEELARRSLDAGAQAVSARTLAQQAQDTVRDMGGRMASLEARLSEVSLQRQQLEELMQSLSRSRDENLVVDIESALRLAQQQAQLTGSAEPLLAALRTAEQRLQRAAQPRLNPVLRAITHDSERIKAAAVTDIPALLVKIDELARLFDDLPLANGAVPALEGEPAPAAADKPAEQGLIRATTGAVGDWFGVACCGSAGLIALKQRCWRPSKLFSCARTPSSSCSTRAWPCCRVRARWRVRTWPLLSCLCSGTSMPPRARRNRRKPCCSRFRPASSRPNCHGSTAPSPRWQRWRAGAEEGPCALRSG